MIAVTTDIKSSLAAKQKQVSEFVSVADATHSLVAAEYTGLSANRMNELRRKAREAGVLIRVMKNRLVRRALRETEYAGLEEELKGHLLLAFSLRDPSAAPRLIRDFIAQYPRNQVRLLALPGQPLLPAQLAELADLPSPEVAAAWLLGVMQQPLVRLLLILQESQGRLVRLLAAHVRKSAGK